MVEIVETALEGVKLITPRRFGDARGWFSETYNAQALAEAGVDITFVQDNQSFSAQKGTVRGLHFQAPPHAQDKLVRVLKGAILDVAVDIRSGSPTYGQWVGEELTAENGHQLLVPKGFLHGFATLTEDVEVFYKCSDFYAPAADGGIRWNDPDIAINWGIADAITSQKDSTAPLLKNFKTPF